MGISILSGAITTFGAGCFVFMCETTPSKKIALLVTSTILISFYASMVLFGALMHIIGPENNQGYIFWFLKKNKE